MISVCMAAKDISFERGMPRRAVGYLLSASESIMYVDDVQKLCDLALKWPVRAGLEKSGKGRMFGVNRWAV